MSSALAGEVFHEAGGAIPVGDPPVEEVLALAGARRRQRRHRAAALVALLVGVVLVGTWLGTRGPAPQPDPEVVAARNPADIAWYANGILHLPEVIVRLPRLADIAAVPDGVVYADQDGRVALVDRAGTVTELDGTAADGQLASHRDRGWVAWVARGSGPELVVHDTLARREVARRPVDAAAVVVAVDQDFVYYTVDGESWAWQLPDGEPVALRGQLADVASAVRAWQTTPDTLRVSQPLFDIDVDVPGTGAVLSEDGELVLTRSDANVPGQVRVYEAASGKDVFSGVWPDEIALAAAFGADHSVTYVVARREHLHEGSEYMRLSDSGPHLLRTCDLDDGTCRTISQFGPDTGRPLLPD